MHCQSNTLAASCYGGSNDAFSLTGNIGKGVNFLCKLGKFSDCFAIQRWRPTCPCLPVVRGRRLSTGRWARPFVCFFFQIVEILLESESFVGYDVWECC